MGFSGQERWQGMRERDEQIKFEEKSALKFKEDGGLPEIAVTKSDEFTDSRRERERERERDGHGARFTVVVVQRGTGRVPVVVQSFNDAVGNGTDGDADLKDNYVGYRS
ncbi:hypothetical protein L6452_02914 [Arctium lappa]|uniref:Uncharacterized protein n=1 Tax=Arctium lappa TaxID=4217 RepID=A0ACB9FMD2_ARCLA|nr:hypothetical protein L6452_02914 [Arctium lappa]